MLLPSNEIHIWSACLLENEPNIPYFLSTLSKDEYHKARNFKFQKDQQGFIISRGILRCLLGRYLNEEPQRIEILYNLWGKPSLSSTHSLHFNLSHSKKYAIYAFTRSYELGVDLEYIDSTLNIEDLAFTILSPQERLYWEKVAPEKKIHAFFKLWVLKESLLKASGKGWLSDEKVLSLATLKTLNIFTAHNIVNEKVIFLYYFETIPGYASALCTKGPRLYPSHYTWEFHKST